MAILEVENISYKYGESGGLVLKDISTSFETGKIYAILGRSGSGKTTLLSLLAGLDVCLNGRILHNGVDLKKINRDRYRAEKIGVVFQQFNLLHRYNAVENVLIAMEIALYDITGRIGGINQNIVLDYRALMFIFVLALFITVISTGLQRRGIFARSHW